MLSLHRPAGRRQPLQTRSLERWPDGSQRWVLLDFQIEDREGAWVDLTFDNPAQTTHLTPVTATDDDGGVTLATGDLSIRLRPGSTGPFVDVSKAAVPLLDRDRTSFVIRSHRGPVAAIVDTLEVEASGPLRAAIHLRGRVPALGLEVSWLVEMFAGRPAIRVRTTIHNPRAAEHAGGFWELGDAGSAHIAEVAYVFALVPDGSRTAVRATIERGTPPMAFDAPFRVHQESSGHVTWRSATHVNAAGVVPLEYAGYRVTAGEVREAPAQASPIVEIASGPRTLAVASRLFWEVFPKAYAVAGDGTLRVELLPSSQEPHELLGGERFTHEFVVAVHGGAEAVAWARDPLTPIVEPTWWEGVGAVPHLAAVVDANAPYERLVRTAIEGDDAFAAKRDRIDEYGWRHYGDLYADHENGPAAGRSPIVSHYNNQYDGVAGMIAQFMRSGDPRWWCLAHDLAEHVGHIDIYWTDADKSAYNGGLFWHTYHYVAAGRATHRSYPRADGVPGGGPSVEHNYSTGLLWHYWMTGASWSRDAVLRLARWTVDMDDGTKTPFRFLSRGPTGLASATGAADYHGPGRGPANAIHTLLNAFRLTGDRAWMAKVEELMRRCIHPADDLRARNLLDAERRWYYTVFLQALGRVLHVKTELGEEDATWHYARASLRHYARWMADHEYPYLDKPEILEYPTETWAAQDMRKCEVFDLASEYAEDAVERARFVERARYFFDQSITTLHRWPTRTWTRPVVLMLSYGHAHGWYEAHRTTLPLLPPSPCEAGPPAHFEPQKVVALRRATRVAIGLAAVTTLLLAWAVSVIVG